MWSVNRISVNPMVALILVFLFWTFSGELVFAQSCDSLNNQSPEPAWLDQNGLLPPKHNPASVPPTISRIQQTRKNWCQASQ